MFLFQRFDTLFQLLARDKVYKIDMFEPSHTGVYKYIALIMFLEFLVTSSSFCVCVFCSYLCGLFVQLTSVWFFVYFFSLTSQCFRLKKIEKKLVIPKIHK